ncbi:SIMPL domain-containing protein [Natrinema salifodinae]|nr:SIMPL domain-containing protein [Natrinema salifodinae]
MDRRQFLAASGVGLAATMAGCTGSPLSSDGDDPGAESDGNESTDSGEITVSAGGQVDAEPDRAVVDIGVEATGESAEAVTDELATGADELRETFDELGVPEENVEEGRYRVHPTRAREAEGFEGSHSFEVTLSDVDRVGEVIDAAIAAGADNVGRVNFSLQEETRAALRKDAIDAALANADDEAAHIADNRGVDLAGTTNVTTGDVQVHPVREAYTGADAAEDAAAPPTEIEADPVSVNADVTVTYSFDG